MRGGTGEAVVFAEQDLSADPDRRERLVLAAFGRPEPRRIDGLGGADPLTTKVAIVAISPLPEIDVVYTIGQVGIGSPVVNRAVGCGTVCAIIPAEAWSLTGSESPAELDFAHALHGHRNDDFLAGDGRHKQSLSTHAEPLCWRETQHDRPKFRPETGLCRIRQSAVGRARRKATGALLTTGQRGSHLSRPVAGASQAWKTRLPTPSQR